MVPNYNYNKLIILTPSLLLLIATTTQSVASQQQQFGRAATSTNNNNADQYRDAFLGQIKQFASLIQDTVMTAPSSAGPHDVHGRIGTRIGQRCRQDILYLTSNALNNVTWALKGEYNRSS